MSGKYADTKLPGNNIEKVFQICESLRERNTDGYMNGAGCKLLAKIKKQTVGYGPGTSCSPFTGTVTALLFDPKFPRDDLSGDIYTPLFNGGNDELPFDKFYHEHNNLNDHGVQSIIDFGLGYEVKPQQMRRGDLVEINWVGHGGHLVFCWDVHLDDKGDVDCFQIIGSNGPAPGVSIYNCKDKRWLTGSNATKPGNGSLKKAKDKIFDPEDTEIIKSGCWLGRPGVAAKKFDKSTFKVKPGWIFVSGSEWSVNTVRVGRFNYDGDPPKPICMKDGSAIPTPLPPGHIDAQPTTIKGVDLQKDPGAVQKVQPKPAKQDEKKPLDWQHEVEQAMQELFHGGWLESDPGESDDINDAKTQAAIKEFQKLFKLMVDGVVGPQTKGEIRKQLPACRSQHVAHGQLRKLFDGGKLKTDPGGGDAKAMKGAVKELQKANGLPDTGVLDAATQEKLKEIISQSEASASQHGLKPMILALYWVGNFVAPGGTATLRMHTLDVRIGETFRIFLKDTAGKEIEAPLRMSVAGPVSEASVQVPADFGDGSILLVRVKSDTLEMPGLVPLYIGTPKVQPAQQTGDLEKLFEYQGNVGEGARQRDYTYTAFRVPGKKQAWFMKGRQMIDLDGAPNCYHPSRTDVMPYDKYDQFETWPGPLDKLANGGHTGNWFGVVTDNGENSGTPIVQGANDPCPGFFVSQTSLADKTITNRGNPRRYADARKIPYLAFPKQIWNEGKTGSLFKRIAAGPTGGIGDFVTAINLRNKKFGHGLIADIGDQPHFGEVSPALSKQYGLLSGTHEPEVLYIVFPHSGAGQGVIPNADEILQKAGKLFDEWGGMSEVERVLGLMK